MILVVKKDQKINAKKGISSLDERIALLEAKLAALTQGGQPAEQAQLRVAAFA